MRWGYRYKVSSRKMNCSFPFFHSLKLRRRNETHRVLEEALTCAHTHQRREGGQQKGRLLLTPRQGNVTRSQDQRTGLQQLVPSGKKAQWGHSSSLKQGGTDAALASSGPEGGSSGPSCSKSSSSSSVVPDSSLDEE